MATIAKQSRERSEVATAFLKSVHILPACKSLDGALRHEHEDKINGGRAELEAKLHITKGGVGDDSCVKWPMHGF